MDINANLQELRETVQRLALLQSEVDLSEEQQTQLLEDGARVAELFEAMDSWLSSGGFLPTAWRR